MHGTVNIVESSMRGNLQTDFKAKNMLGADSRLLLGSIPKQTLPSLIL